MDRFWKKVDINQPDECWPWNASTSPKGYGNFSFNGMNTTAHRISWMLTYGPIPDGLLVCHKCDNPPCCNPYHLFLGTISDNQKDMARKGRANMDHSFLYGENHPNSKLTIKQVIEIKKELKNYRYGTLLRLARKYEVSNHCIFDIKRGKSWSWLEV